MDLLIQALSRIETGEALALVTVIRVSGSAPRHVGAKMLVDAEGRSVATVGGGRVELDVTRAAVEVNAGGRARRIRHHLVRDLAMCCGGAMEFYIEPIAQSYSALRQAIASLQERRPAMLVTPLDGTPKTVEEMPSPAILRAVCRDGSLFEPLWPRDRVVIFGAGHVARAIGPIADGVDFDVVICDDGDTGALVDLDDVPWVRSVVESFDLRDVEAELGRLGCGDYALIMTREHAIDQAILEKLLQSESLTYLGLIGSRGKIGRFRKRLTAKGVLSESRWDKLHAPIGVDIGAETPEEIAISVVAELISVRRRGHP